MTTIAKKYLISDVGLRKICISFNIPLPRVGHWEKIKAQKSIEIAPLPETFSGKDEILLKIRTENDPQPSQKDPVKALAKELNNDQSFSFAILQTLALTDPRILKTQKALMQKDRYQNNGLVHARGENHLSITVSPTSIDRALRFMQGLISSLERRGHELQIRSSETVVIVFNQSMPIAVREKLKIRKISTNWGGYNNEYEPEGPLILKLGKHGTKEWQDGSRKIEDQLSEIIARMEIEANRRIEQEIENKKRQDERQEKEKQRIAVENRKNQELLGFKRLIVDAEKWQISQRIRSYLEAVEQKAVRENALTKELKDWLHWAHKKTDWYDPLINTEDEWLSDEDRNSFLALGKKLNNIFFDQTPESTPYFPRPWYAK
jgi:hypothetical protein